jgi:hypothetical protein
MAKKTYLYVVRDEYHAPLSITCSKDVAKRQLRVLANYVAWNRGFKITDATRNNIIYFQNYEFVDFVELPYFGIRKEFMRHFGFTLDDSKYDK